MSLTLFGVETNDGPRKSPATSTHAPLSLTSSGGSRRTSRVPSPALPGTLASHLGLKVTALSDRSADERRRDRDDWLARIYAGPRPEPTVEDMLLGSRPSLDFWGLAQKHITAAPGDEPEPVDRAARHQSFLNAIASLTGAYSQTACSSRSETACSSLETFPDRYLQREVYQATLNDRARVLAQTQAEFHRLGKFNDVRYLRAIVRNRNVELYAVRSAMRKCGQRRHSRGGVVAYARPGKDGRDRVTLSGIIRCGSVHSCPRCAPRISAQRAELLKRVIARHRDAGGGVYMLTLTVPHSVQMPIRTLRRAVSAAWKLTQQGKGWRELKKCMQFVGSVASRETTHGGNGWHPHMHILIATRAPIADEQLRELETEIYERWRSAVARQAVTTIAPPSRERGVQLRAQTDATYLEQLGLADELLGAIHKLARDGNRTPFEIMADYARQTNGRDAKILREYHRGIKGARQLTWSRGKDGAEDLRKLYAGDASSEQLQLLDGDDNNATLLEKADKLGVAVVGIPAPQWDALARVMRSAHGDAESELVLAIEEHGAAGARAVLEHAYRIGLQLAEKRPRLKRWLWWLDPRRRETSAVVVVLPREANGQVLSAVPK